MDILKYLHVAQNFGDYPHKYIWVDKLIIFIQWIKHVYHTIGTHRYLYTSVIQSGMICRRIHFKSPTINYYI